MMEDKLMTGDLEDIKATPVMLKSQKALTAILAFGRESLKLLKKKNKITPLIKYYDRKIAFYENGFGTESIIRHNYRPFIIQYQKEINDLEETKTAIRILVDENILPPITIANKCPPNTCDWHSLPFEEIFSLCSFSLLEVLADYIEQNKSFKYSDMKFTELYLKYENVWLRESYTIQTYLPLIGFNTDQNIIELFENSCGLIIRRLTDQEKSDIWPSNFDIHGLNIYDYNRCNFAIISNYQIARNESITVQAKKDRDNRKCMEAVITALRLLKEGAVGDLIYVKTSNVRCITVYSGDSFIGNFPLPSRGLINASIGKKYHLQAWEIVKLKAVFDVLTNPIYSSRLSHLDFSLRRFNLAYSRDITEDKIIDLTITLESILLYMDDNKQELSNRFALRGSALLSDIRNVENTFEILKTLYHVRSKIVHEGKPLDKIAQPNGIFKNSSIRYTELPILSEQITREIIIEYLTGYVSKNNIQKLNVFNNELDKSILKCISVKNLLT